MAMYEVNAYSSDDEEPRRLKIILLILLTSCTILKAEYPRHKIRGPPHGVRVPPSQQFAKKWHQPSQYPPRNPVRSRPIPVHMPPSHKIPMGVPQAPPRAVAPPVRNFWKNTLPNIKYPQEKPYIPPKEKPFLIAAPSINTPEFDYHIQTNSIPTTHTNPIKQVGEKGPIHTIPAPNLSLKDKPIVVEEPRYQHNTPQHNAPYIQVEQSHQYQVTEQPEPPPKQKLYRAQQQLIQQQQQQIHQQQLQQQHAQQQQQIHQQQLQQQQLQLQQEQLLQQELQKQIELQPQQLYYTTDAIAMSQTLPLPTPKTSQGDIYLSSQLNPKDLYQLIGAAYPQQEVASQIQAQDLQQSFYKPQQSQQVPNYQALLSQQLFQPEQGFVQHPEAQVASDKAFQPELHSFNYDEQAHQMNQKGLSQKEISSLVTAAYNLDSSVAASNQISARNSIDPLAQAQLIQSYFDTRSDVEENDVEPDAKPGAEQENQPDKIKEELLSSSYFSSLPNKEAADRLAELQAAGKINSNLMKISSDSQQSNKQMTISVADDPEDEAQEDDHREDGNENYAENSKEQPVEYDDYSQEEMESSASEEENLGFGHRLQPKTGKNQT